VLAACSALLRDGRLPTDCIDQIRTIQRNVQLEARLIDDLLDLTRIARDKLRLELQSVDAHELLRQAVDICSPELIRKRLRLKIELSASRRHVRADPARLQQVYWNLINNAMKFTPAGGEITVRSRNEDDAWIAVDIADTGIGIEPSMLPRLFVAFEQAEVSAARRFGGLGLGLAISRKLVEMHEGQITAASAGPGQGSCFTVRLKPVEPLVIAPTPDAPVFRETQPAGVRILLVDDHEDTNRAMRRLLERWGYKVACAFSVESALQAASSEPFDLLISDIGLPDGSGLELMRELLAQPRPRPLRGIALSGFGMEDDIRKSREAGFHDHLTKPVSFQKLQAAIRDVVEQSQG
jgi:CheY-like chemotaxis protein